MSILDLDFTSLYPENKSYHNEDYGRSIFYILDRNKNYKYIDSVLLTKYNLDKKDLFNFSVVKTKVRNYDIFNILNKI